MPLVLAVNGVRHELDVPSDQPLLYVLRDHLQLTGTKYGCGEGQCGACTVLLDGKPVRSCLTPVSAAANRKVTTIEGIAEGERLHPVQQAFLEQQAFQCGYCTSGMIMSAVALLKKNPNPSEAEIVRSMDGNLCRCGTYSRIVPAVQKAASVSKS
jgi:aerobic-type carbon monoxide dehydrogenase small subunit (CoxS/CutS family)